MSTQFSVDESSRLSQVLKLEQRPSTVNDASDSVQFVNGERVPYAMDNLDKGLTRLEMVCWNWTSVSILVHFHLIVYSIMHLLHLCTVLHVLITFICLQSKGRAIQVEHGIGERIPSMDTRRPRHRDSVVIQVCSWFCCLTC